MAIELSEELEFMESSLAKRILSALELVKMYSKQSRKDLEGTDTVLKYLLNCVPELKDLSVKELNWILNKNS